MYKLQSTSKKQYTLVARHWERKLVTGLPDSSKGRDEDFLVITGNWQNPLFSCPLILGIPDKDFTKKEVAFVERKAVEHLLKRPCFVDSAGRPRSASVLLDYVPTYNSFQKGPVVKDLRQIEVTVSRPGKDQEDIILAVPLTKKKGVHVPYLVTPLSDPHFVPSTQPTEIGLPIIRFPSLFDSTHQSGDDMPVQSRSIDIRTVLGTSVPQSSGTSSFPPPPGFSQGEDVMRKRKRGVEENDEDEGEQELPPTKPFKKNCDFLVDGRAEDEGYSVLKSGDVRGGQVANTVGRALLLPEDMKVWQEKRSKHMLENLKSDSMLAVQGIFEAGNRLLETECLLNLSLEENKRLKDFEKSASARIRAAECAHKSAEAGLMTADGQAIELKEKLDREYTTSSVLQVENSGLKDAINEARAEVQKAEDEAQSYYDQGFDEAANSLKHRPFGVVASEERDGEDVAEDTTVPGPHEVLKELELANDPEVAKDLGNLEADDQIPVVEVQEGKDDSDDETNVDVVG
uniref:Uncharacterized protein n=1 Tax=Fagus sylvatica TaxID=28930 RepID=A0A2N9G7V4_FAGSY